MYTCMDGSNEMSTHAQLYVWVVVHCHTHVCTIEYIYGKCGLIICTTYVHTYIDDLYVFYTHIPQTISQGWVPLKVK